MLARVIAREVNAVSAVIHMRNPELVLSAPGEPRREKGLARFDAREGNCRFGTLVKHHTEIRADLG